jgi:prepilin-type N-terminal cleavage/methylation domain-containing protein
MVAERMKKKLLNSRGFTLAEVMVAAAMVGVVSLGVMQLMNNMTKGQKEFEQNAEMTQIVERIRSGLQDGDTCNYSLVALKWNRDGALYTQADIDAADMNNFSATTSVPIIAKADQNYFTNDAAGDNQPVANLNIADDTIIATACDATYGGPTASTNDLVTAGCLKGSGKGRLLIHQMWLGNEGGNRRLYIKFLSGQMINYYLQNPAADMDAYYWGLYNGTPEQKEQAQKMSGAFGRPITIKAIDISLSIINGNAAAANQGAGVGKITNPIGGLGDGDVTSCFTTLTDTIETSCSNIGGTYMPGDGSCRSLRIRSNNDDNIAENDYDARFPTIPALLDVNGRGGNQVSIATEGHLFVGPLTDSGADENVGGNAWVSGRMIVADQNEPIDSSDANQGDILSSGTLRMGTKATDVGGPLGPVAPGDVGSMYASGGLQLGAELTVPGAGEIWTSGNIWTQADYHGQGGIALGTNNALDPAPGAIVTSGGVSLGTVNNINPGAGDTLASSGISIGTMATSVTNPGDGDIHASGGLALGGVGTVDPDAGDVRMSGGIAMGTRNADNPTAGEIRTSGTIRSFGGSLHLGTSAVANAASAGAGGNIRISGALNVGAGYNNSTAGQAHIQDKAYSYGLTNAETNPDALTTIDWVRNRIARTLAPTGSDVNAIASDILVDAIKDTGSGVYAIQRDTCQNTYIRNRAGTRVAGTWVTSNKTCRIGNDIKIANDCSIGYECNQVYSNTFVYAKTYIRALSYIRSGTYVRSDTYMRSYDYMYATNYVRGSRFCIGGSTGTACITKVRSNACSGIQKVVSWRNGHVTCINEARWY